MCTISLSCYRKHFLQILQGLPVLVKQNRDFSMKTCLMFKKFEKIINILLLLPVGCWHTLIILWNGRCLTQCWQLNRNGYTIINAWKGLVLLLWIATSSCRADASHCLEKSYGLEVLYSSRRHELINCPKLRLLAYRTQ